MSNERLTNLGKEMAEYLLTHKKCSCNEEEGELCIVDVARQFLAEAE